MPGILISTAADSGIYASQIGVMGISAGIRLAATAAAHVNKKLVAGNSGTISVLPDFAMNNTTTDDNWMERLKNWMNRLQYFRTTG